MASTTLFAFVIGSSLGGGVTPPSLEVNGATASDNSAVAHGEKLAAIDIELHGTPGAPFALLLAAEALDGEGSEPNVLNGFFLAPKVSPLLDLDLPIHPILDGIGTSYIASALNASGQASLAPDDILADQPSSLARFDSHGAFRLTLRLPPAIPLVNIDPSPGAPNPFVVDPESTAAATIALWLQVVELDVSTLQILVGNGVKLVFDPLVFAGTLAYAEGTDGATVNPAVTSSMRPGSLVDADLGDDAPGTFTADPTFSTLAPGGLDFWLIGLAGQQPLYSASNPPNAGSGFGNPLDPDAATTVQNLHKQSSGIELFTGLTPARDNENKEFPRIQLPGRRQLFHWRDPQTNVFGFGILFEETGTWRDLTPGLGFTFSTTTISPWEYEVAVSPDGDRAVAVLDPPAGANDRLFVFNLEPGGLFSNGLPYAEAGVGPADAAFFKRLYEESIAILDDGAGSWVAFFGGTNATAVTLATYPNRVFRLGLNDSGATALVVLPGGAFPAISRIDRQGVVSQDHRTYCVVAGVGATPAAVENLLAIRDVTPTGHSLINCSGGLTEFFTLAETNDATDGGLGMMNLSADGSRIAFARENGTRRHPRVAQTDGSSAGSTQDLVVDIADGGPFDTVDLGQSRDYHFSADAKAVVFEQGFWIAGALGDRFDLFVVDLATNVVRNLTRTGKTGPTATPFTLLGPWDPQPDLNANRPTVEPAGSFVARNGEWAYYVRESRYSAITAEFDRLNLIGVSIAPDLGTGTPSFDLVNVTGKEFPPNDTQPAPTTGAPDVVGDQALVFDVGPEYLNLRRVGGDGPLKDHMLFTGRIANATGTNVDKVDQLFLFDPENPAPAVQLTSFTTDPGSYGVALNSRITSVTPDRSGSRAMFIVDPDGDGATTGQLCDLMLVALDGGKDVARVPETASPFSRLITAGSAHFYEGSHSGVAFVSGFLPRPISQTDGITVLADSFNPVDASPYFVRLTPSQKQSLLLWIAPGSRAAMIFDVNPD